MAFSIRYKAVIIKKIQKNCQITSYKLQALRGWKSKLFLDCNQSTPRLCWDFYYKQVVIVSLKKFGNLPTMKFQEFWRFSNKHPVINHIIFWQTVVIFWRLFTKFMYQMSYACNVSTPVISMVKKVSRQLCGSYCP